MTFKPVLTGLLASTTALLSSTNLALAASITLPSTLNTNQDPIEKIKTFLIDTVFEGLVFTGIAIAACAIAYIIVSAIAGGRPNTRWAALAILGGIALTSIGWLLDKMLS